VWVGEHTQVCMRVSCVHAFVCECVYMRLRVHVCVGRD